MNKFFKYLLVFQCTLFFSITASSWAQDLEEELDDLEDDLEGDLNEGASEKNQDTSEAQKATSEENMELSESEDDLEDIGDIEEEDVAKEEALELEDLEAEEAQPSVAKEEKKVEEKAIEEDLPESLLSSENPQIVEAKESALTQEENEDLSDLFAKVPLRPSMSPENWRLFAGEQLSKNYKIRRKDSLWKVSEVLFGNPYLWPKIWQLNAAFGNPHIVEPGIDLFFYPGNASSAPQLALVMTGGNENWGPLIPMKLSLELSEENSVQIKYDKALQDEKTPFLDRYFKNKPVVLAKVPSRQRESLFYMEGSVFEVPSLPDGDYSVTRSRIFEGAYGVSIVGEIKVEGKIAKITRSFTEILAGDEIMEKMESLGDLQIAYNSIDQGQELEFLPSLQTSTGMAYADRVMGLKIPSSLNIAPGSMIAFDRGISKQESGLGLVVSVDNGVGTLWLISSQREIPGGKYVVY